MNIRSTSRPMVANRPAGNRQAYKESLEKFDELAPSAYDRYQTRSSIAVNATSVVSAVTVIGGTAAFYTAGEPILDSLRESVHPAILVPLAVVGMAAPLVGGLYGAMKASEFVHEKFTKDSEFEAIKTEHTEVRDAYRNELMKAANDEGVEEILNPRWEALKNADTSYHHVGGPVGKEASMNTHVNELEWLLDMRQQDDWRGEIAREQDDPQVARKMIREAADNPD